MPGVKQRILWIEKIILHRKTIPRIKAKLASTSLEDLGADTKPKTEIKKSQAGLRSVCGAEQHSLHAMI